MQVHIQEFGIKNRGEYLPEILDQLMHMSEIDAKSIQDQLSN